MKDTESSLKYSTAVQNVGTGGCFAWSGFSIFGANSAASS